MKSIGKQIGIILSFFFLFIAVSALPAFAAPKHGDVTLQTLRQERMMKTASIAGELTCKMAEVNNGQPCMLKLKDSQSGKIYILKNADQAMRLYQNGFTQVKIQGAFEDISSVRVSTAEAI